MVGDNNEEQPLSLQCEAFADLIEKKYIPKMPKKSSNQNFSQRSSNTIIRLQNKCLLYISYSSSKQGILCVFSIKYPLTSMQFLAELRNSEFSFNFF